MKKNIKIIIILIIILNLTNVKASTRKTITLDKCVDGDTATFKIDQEIKKVRFLAINTPESTNKLVEPYGKEASEYTCKKLTNAKKIEIEYDPDSNKEDKYGRVLGWIYVDDKLLQEDLVSKGYAEVKYIYGKYLYTDVLDKKQTKAQNKKLRIWSDEAIKEKQASNSKKDTKTDLEEEFWDYLEDFLNKIVRKLVKRLKSMI